MKMRLLTAVLAMGISPLSYASPVNDRPSTAPVASVQAMNVVKSDPVTGGHREIRISMQDTAIGEMKFSPSKLSLKSGTTVRFLIENQGDDIHEFILDKPEINAIHKQLMGSRAETHSAENAITLAPGETGELTWTFTGKGTVEFACLIQGHYEAGMFGRIIVL